MLSHASCGNGKCDSGETETNCLKDCGTATNDGKEKCVATGGTWEYVPNLPCIASNKESRLKKNFSCIAWVQPGYSCKCPNGAYYGSYEEGCIKKTCYGEGEGIAGLVTSTTPVLSCCAGLVSSPRTSCTGNSCVTTEGFICKNPGASACKMAGTLFKNTEADCCAGLMKVYPDGGKIKPGTSENYQVTCAVPNCVNGTCAAGYVCSRDAANLCCKADQCSYNYYPDGHCVDNGDTYISHGMGDFPYDYYLICRNGKWKTMTGTKGCNGYECDSGNCIDNKCYSTDGTVSPCENETCWAGSGFVCRDGNNCCKPDECGYDVFPNGQCVKNGGTRSQGPLATNFNWVCRNGAWKTVAGAWGCNNFACDNGTCVNNICSQPQ